MSAKNHQYIHFDQSHLQLVLSQILRLSHLGGVT